MLNLMGPPLIDNDNIGNKHWHMLNQQQPNSIFEYSYDTDVKLKQLDIAFDFFLRKAKRI